MTYFGVEEARDVVMRYSRFISSGVDAVTFSIEIPADAIDSTRFEPLLADPFENILFNFPVPDDVPLKSLVIDLNDIVKD